MQSDIFLSPQPSLEEPLDLGFFACEQVNVSFAAVTAYGLSDYSQATTDLCIHGGQSLRQPL